ncbi:unnamed protein product [Schistosoma margrebowiei]|uniref:Uncharacterized protein n=1 Tax=Schistosoma margrebowiei TaxID=48269 RepID=A0A183LJJ1_9TREM|nr:unnamed protein product [Schistosoma margrebowiei]
MRDRRARSSANSRSSSRILVVHCIPCFPSDVDVFMIQANVRFIDVYVCLLLAKQTTSNEFKLHPIAQFTPTIYTKGKSKILRYNIACTNPITIDGERSEDVKTFTYLGSIIDEHSGSDADVKALIEKAREAYLQLKNI